MSFAFVRRGALGAVLLPLACLGACSSSAAHDSPASGADAATVNPATATLTFDPTTSPCPNGMDLCLAPGQSISLGVTLDAPDTTVSFALEGDYADASLSQEGVTTSGGHATVTLRAPASAAAFDVRASAPGAADARLNVAVSAAGFATIQVAPSYSGRRPVTSLTASAFVNATCADRAKEPLTDGNPSANAASGGALAVANVPAGYHIAVQVRVAFYASGCADVTALVPGSSTNVPVDVFDIPLALDQTDLESKLTFVPDAAGAGGWSSMLDEGIARAESAFISPNESSEAGALLDAMQAAAPSAEQSAFAANRQAGGWDAIAGAWLDGHPPTLASRVSAWLGQGKPADLGLLAAHIGYGTTAGTAAITLETFSGFDATSAGLSVSNTAAPFAWSADADDDVHLEGTVHLAPTALVAISADARAAADVSGATDVGSALATALDCDGLSTALVGSGVSYPTCDDDCTTSLCGSALASMWSAARGASVAAGDDVLIQITASAAASVGTSSTATSAPVSFSGSWVGDVGPAGSTSFPMAGVATADSTDAPK